MAKRLIIVGAGGHGKVCAETAELVGRWEEIVFVDRLFPELTVCGAWPVIAESIDVVAEKGDDVFVAIGDNQTRHKVCEQVVDSGAPLVTLVHPSAVVSKYADLGEGVLVCAGAVVGVSSTIGDHTIINTSVSVDHDCLLGKAVHVSPGANLTGEVEVGDFSWIGTGVSTKQQVNVASNVIVGAGSVLVADICEPGTYVGAPAKRIK